MPACGSEGACLQGLWPNDNKTGLASPQCLGPPLARPKRRNGLGLSNGNANFSISIARSRTQQQVRQVSRSSRVVQGLLAPGAWLTGWLASWIAYWLWLCWLLLQLPLGALGLGLRLVRWLTRPLPWIGGGPGLPEAARPPGRQRCVLISGGSTVQAVHLARNLSRAGARVVVCELEGLFGLARFSRACASYHCLPRTRSAAEYVSALQEIVRKERVDAYVPVAASPGAYYDGLAKPHLERLGCECFVPGAKEVALLDDPLELLRRARALGLPTPRHRLLARLPDAAELYEGSAGRLAGPHYALPAGPAGLRGRAALREQAQLPLQELRLPSSLGEFGQLIQRQRPDDGRPWLVLRDPGGPHFLTCTTLRDSRLLANVTCRVEEAQGPAGPARLLPEHRPEVERWLERFFSRGFARDAKVSGHLCFRLAAPEDRPDELVPISCRVGLGLAYLSYTEAHARLLWPLPERPAPGASRTCRHRARFHFSNGRSAATATTLQQQQQPRSQQELRLDKREALLLYWDPLPYCVYSYLQLPFRRIVELLGAQQSQHKPPLAVVE